NAQTEALFGYRREELLGQPVAMLLPERFRAKHPDHLARYFTAPSRRSLGAGRDLSGQRKDGSEFSVEISLSPLETEEGVLASAAIRDITERKRQEALLGEQARLAAFGRDVGLALNQSDSLPDMLRHCCEAAVQHLQAAFARIWTLDEKQQVLELQASVGLY